MPFSATAKSILTILNNISELIVHNNRADALDAMKALKVYADHHKFYFSEDKVDNFCSVLLDSRPQTLHSLIFDIAGDVIATDKSKK